jgi:methionine sulfoxide reductase heme-binding subunit
MRGKFRMFTIDSVPLANGIGFLSLSAYTLTLLPTNIRFVLPQFKQADLPKWLLKNRRLIGITAFVLALWHGYLLAQKRDFDFLDFESYVIYVQGVSTFIILTLLAVTSNDWSVKRLKKNWKRLQRLTYVAMFLLTWHVWDKMAEHWSYLTPIGLMVIIITNLMFLRRRWLERQQEQEKANKKVAQPIVRDKVTA